MGAHKEETPIVQAALNWLKANGGDGFHVHGSSEQRRDEPDVCGEYRSKVLDRWLHLKCEAKTKRKGSKTSTGQDIRLKIYAARGYVTGVFTNLDEFIQIIRDYEEAHRAT